MLERILVLIERRVEPVNLDPTKIKKVLIVDLNFMGDMLMSSPAIKSLWECTGAQIDVLVYDFCKPILEANPYVDNIYTTKWSFPCLEALRARWRGYDLVLQFNTSLKTNALLWIAGKTRLGYNFRHRGCLLNVRVPISYRTARSGNRSWECLRLLHGVLGQYLASTSSADLIFNLPECKPKFSLPFIVVHVSPAQDHEKRRWDKFNQLLPRLVKEIGLPIALTGTYKDRHWVQWIAGGINPYFNNMCGDTSIAELASLIKQAKFVVTVNTFAMHLAIALGTPTVAIIGGTPASVVAPIGNPNFRYVEDAGLAEYDPETGLYPIRINEITVDQVMEQIKLLETK